jgi:uncharacterized membrane protein
MKVILNQAQKRAAIQRSCVLAGGRFLVSCVLLYAATRMTDLLGQQSWPAAVLLLVSLFLVSVAGLSIALCGVHFAFASIVANKVQQHKGTQP